MVNFRILSTSSLEWKGFVIKSFAPAPKATILLSLSSRAVTIMIGVNIKCGSARRILHTLKPSGSGIIRSSRIRSGLIESAVSCAFELSFTAVVWKPSMVRSFPKRTVTCTSSSTIIIFVIIFSWLLFGLWDFAWYTDNYAGCPTNLFLMIFYLWNRK